MSKSRDIADSAATINFIDTVSSNVQTQLNAKGVGSVTSVGGTGSVSGLTLTGTVTSSGNLTLGGTLDDINLASGVTGTLPAANGGTGITAAGASGNVLTSTGSGWASTAPAGGGALELISTTTVSGTPSTIDITSGFSSTYDNYIVIASGVSSSANNDDVYMQVYKNSTLLTSSYTYNNQSGSQLFNYSGFNNIGYVWGNDTGWQVNIINANSMLFTVNSTGLFRAISTGYNNTGTGGITGIRFLFQSGSTTFTQGQIRLYGIKKS